MGTGSTNMRTSDVLRALADQLDALGDVLNHPITATVYDFGYKHEVTIQPFGDDDQRDAALAYAIAATLGAEVKVRALDEAKVSVEFATAFSSVDLAMFAHVGRKAADRAADDAATEAFVDVADAERYAQRDEYVNADDPERTTLAEQLRAHGAEQAAQDAEADAFHAQRRADEAEANGEYVDYAEAEAVREIEREMAIEAGDDSEIDRQVAEDDARAERNAALDSTWADPAVRRAVRETIAENEACARCKVPFDPDDKTFDGAAEALDTGFCNGCIDNCHEAGADHRCIICAPRTAENEAV